MKSQSIQFKNQDGITLSGRIDLPEDENPVAWALLAHCFTCGKNLKSIGHICRALTQKNIAVLRFDFTGLGNSEGEFSASNLTTNIADLLAAADWLATHQNHPSILIGHSFGGAAVLQAAQHLPELKAVVSIAAPYDPQHVTQLIGSALSDVHTQGHAKITIAGREFTIGKKFIEDLATHKSKERIKNLGAALLVLHSPNDKTVDIENARLIYQAAKHPKSFISLDDTDHLLTREEDALYTGDMIASWVSRYLDIRAPKSTGSPATDNRVTVRTENEGFFSEVHANGYTMTADEPVSYGGTGRGPTPYDYLLVALGSCTSMTLQMYARNKKWPLESAVVRLTHDKIHAADCQQCKTEQGKIDRFERELELNGNLDAAQRQRLLEIAERCPVHRTIHSDLIVSTTLKEQ